MTAESLSILRDQLRDEEGVRHVVYDDATGHSLGPGMVIQGHPTVGVGRALDVNPLSDEEVNFLLENDLRACIDDLNQHLGWWVVMNEVRQRVLVQMRFQLGMQGLLGFHQTLAAMQDGRYEDAADEMLHSKAAWQAQARWMRLSQRMKTGVETT